MKIETRNNLIIILVIAGLFGISIILFQYRDFDAALYFSIIGIPLFFIFFAYQYIKNLRNSRPDPGLVLKTQEAEKIAYDFKNLDSVSKELNRTYGVQADELCESIKTLASKELPGIGINVVEAEGAYVTEIDENTIKKVDLDKIDNVATEIHKLDGDFKNKIQEFTNNSSMAYLSYVNTLKNSGYMVEPSISKLQADVNNKKSETGTIAENIHYLDNITMIFREIISSSLAEADKLKTKVKELGKDVSSIEYEMNNVKVILESRNPRDLEKGIVSLTKIMKNLESSAGGDFNAIKNNLLSNIERILESVERIDNDQTQKLQILEEKIKKLGSAAKIHELQQIEPQIIPIANEIAKEVYETIQINESLIKQAGFPQLFYPDRQQFEKEYNDLLNESSVKAYSEKFVILSRIMIPIMEKSNLKSKVIGIYRKIENIIKNELKAKGKVTPEILKVKNPEEFIELYSYFHPEIQYDPLQKTLSTVGTTGLSKLSMKVTNDKIQPLLEAEFILKRDDKVIKKTVSDREGNAMFADLNKGSYNLLIKLSGYKTQTKKLELDNDLALDVRLSARSPGEEACKDKEEEAKKALVKVKDIIQKKINSEKYILSTYDLKVKPERIPCLLYLWSKGNEMVKFIKVRNDYMIYDVSALRKEIKTLIENNLTPGKKENIVELSEGFLSAPLPIEEIIVIVDELKKESDYYKNVDHDLNMIWKNSGGIS